MMLLRITYAVNPQNKLIGNSMNPAAEQRELAFSLL